MSAEKATALVLRTTDWSETSRIATLWTREFGRVRVLAKGGKRLKSNFESALDLLTVCSVVFLRKSSGSLDLLTEARVERRFGHLRQHFAALYGAYYVAELLSGWTEDYDPHPALFDEALDTLATLGKEANEATALALRLARFEVVLLRELGYSPALEACTACQAPAFGRGWAFSAAVGGVLCPACLGKQRERRPLSAETWQLLRELTAAPERWREPASPAARKELRQLLGHYVTYLMGRRPRLLPYLGS